MRQSRAALTQRDFNGFRSLGSMARRLSRLLAQQGQQQAALDALSLAREQEIAQGDRLAIQEVIAPLR